MREGELLMGLRGMLGLREDGVGVWVSVRAGNSYQ
jgi:hypothetical protein